MAQRLRLCAAPAPQVTLAVGRVEDKNVWQNQGVVCSRSDPVVEYGYSVIEVTFEERI